jgi:hypothetical protein
MPKSQDNTNIINDNTAQEPNHNYEQSSQQLSYKSLYLKEKKKSSIFLILSIVLTILFFGTLAWAVVEANNDGKKGIRNGQGNGMFDDQAGPNDQNGRGRGMMMNFKNFLNSDGSVNTEEVKSFVSRMPSGTGSSNFQTRINQEIDQAVKNGTITQDQATAIKNAISSAAASSSSNNSTTN